MTEQLSENRKMTKAMAAIERRFSGTQMKTAAITYDEFIAIGNYIVSLEDNLVRANDKLSGNPDSVFDECPGCGGVTDNGYDRSWPEPNPYYCTKCQEDDEVIYIPDRYEQAREALRIRQEHLSEMRNHKLVMKSAEEIRE